jgi:hypothetical protein
MRLMNLEKEKHQTKKNPICTERYLSAQADGVFPL